MTLEKIAQTLRVRPSKLFKHGRRAYPAFSILPALVQEAYDLALLVAAEVKLSLADANITKLGMRLDGRFGV
jgi:hypothetical protein